MDAFINSDLRTHIGRRLADGEMSASGDIGTDREDSPLQSNRSSTFEFVNILITIILLVVSVLDIIQYQQQTILLSVVIHSLYHHQKQFRVENC